MRNARARPMNVYFVVRPRNVSLRIWFPEIFRNVLNEYFIDSSRNLREGSPTVSNVARIGTYTDVSCRPFRRALDKKHAPALFRSFVFVTKRRSPRSQLPSRCPKETRCQERREENRGRKKFPVTFPPTREWFVRDEEREDSPMLAMGSTVIFHQFWFNRR